MKVEWQTTPPTKRGWYRVYDDSDLETLYVFPAYLNPGFSSEAIVFGKFVPYSYFTHWEPMDTTAMSNRDLLLILLGEK